MRRLLQIFRKKNAGAAPVNTVAPTAITVADPTPPIEPTVPSESALIGSNGTWTGTPTITYAYQWQRDIDSVWTDVEGATSSSFIIPQVGDFRCKVTATNAFGSAVAYTNTITAA